jgi:hypothetical protein
MKKRYPIFLNRCRQNIGNMRPIIFFNDETYRKTMITEGNIFNFLTGHSTEYINSKDFLLDSLFCEWAYILNFDEELFEVYKGFNQSQQIDKGRYAATKSPVDDDYYGVTIYDRVPFANLLPSRWAKFLPVTDTRVENYFNNLEKRPSFLGLIGD